LRGALITVLTIGCTFGAINLAVMGFQADLNAVWRPLIQAHGYSQMFGWVGLFIMGVAYHTVTRFQLRPLRHPGLVRPAFALVVAGLVLRFVSQPFAAHPALAAVMVLSALLGLGGVSLFAWGMFDTLRHGADGAAPPVYTLYLRAGFAWFWAMAAATVLVTGHLALHGLDTIPPAWNAPYLRATLSGAIVTIILAYTVRTVPSLLGLQPHNARRFYPIFWAYTGAVLAQIVADSGVLGGASYPLASLGALGELGALGAFVLALNLYRAPATRAAHNERNPWPARFIKTAYGWLLIAAGLNASYAVSGLAGYPAPHAFVASYHHALTVGFISLMIVGMSMKVLPVFIGLMNRHARLAGVVFGLLLAGNTLRVLTESLAHVYGGPFYALMGLSGLIEVIGLACYAALLWRALSQPSYGAGAARAGFWSVSGRKLAGPVISIQPTTNHQVEQGARSK
jgi:hypothetical protein